METMGRSPLRKLAIVGAVLLWACASDDERGNVGPPLPASDYCTGLGYKVQTTDEGTSCIFPDASTCEVTAFFRGQCGQSFSFCQKQGGTIASVRRSEGSFTTIEGECTVRGAKCSEQSFFQTKKCP